MDLVDALDAAAAAQSGEQRDQLCRQQGQLLQWLRHKLPTNAELAQVTPMPYHGLPCSLEKREAQTTLTGMVNERLMINPPWLALVVLFGISQRKGLALH